jgi:class 3 adenylate cyclase/tetratricopeptide (TPR) repeat protein
VARCDTYLPLTNVTDLLLDAFVPTLIRQKLAKNPSLPTGPDAERFHAALLLADVSGFSTLAKTYARRGPRGAEDLKDLLNLFFGRLVDVVDSYGGQVLKFPGDATLALWPSEGDLSAAAHRAAQCALTAQQALRGIVSPDGIQLHVRAGVGMGEVCAACVGGVAGRWELLVTGDPLAQAIHSMSLVSPGGVAVSSKVWERIGPDAQASKLADGVYRVDAVAASPPALSSAALFTLGSDAAPVLRAYVPRSVQARLEAGQSDWLAEFRRVSVLFINLGVFDDLADEALGELQRAIVAVQTAVDRYGGSINQVLADDKGMVVVCGWGLALHTHGDNEVRATRAALDLHRELANIGVGASFGIATGEVFTGLRGNQRRCEYAMIGDVVNIAARLMQAADQEILCDLATVEAAGKRIKFEQLVPIRIKGHEGSVAVSRPAQLSTGSADIVGRVEERRMLGERLRALSTGNDGGVVVLEGDAGIGKSRLVVDLVEQSVSYGVRALVATADAIERSAPYHAWRTVFDSLLGLEEIAGRGGAERRVLDLLESDARLLPFAPLLNPVLRLNLRETDQSARVPPRGRAVLTRELLVQLFRCTTRDEPTLLVVEDAHWCDSASWAFAETIERELRTVLLLVVMRPVSREEKPSELLRLIGRERACVLRLDVLSSEDTRALICRRLRARVLSEPVARLIRDKGEGHPFFTEELGYMLRDRNLIEVDHGMCQFKVATEETPESVQLPNTVQVVVASRIDQLTIPQQLTIKVASVFGRTFDLPGLRAAHPIETDAQELQSHVTALVDRHLVELSASQPLPTYAFKHAITQEVAYSLLPYALRRRLHAAAAEWYERQHPDDLSPFYPLLAHHWSRAENNERAIFYLDKAGEQALGRYANEEALNFYRQALEIDAQAADQSPSAPPIVLGRHRVVSAREARHVRWERRLGDAAMNLGRWEEGRQHFERALALVGHPLPASNRGFAIGLATQVTLQCARRLVPRPFGGLPNEATEVLREGVRACERLGAIAFHYERLLPVVYALVAALNLAERLGPTPELAISYADVSNILGYVRRRRLARAYQRLAKRTAAQLNDPVTSVRVLARAAVFPISMGDWSVCNDLENEMSSCERIGDSYQWVTSANVRARVANLRGEFELAARLALEIRKRAAVHGSLAHEVWGIDCQTWALLYLGHYETLEGLIERGLHLMATAQIAEPISILNLFGARALAHVYRSEMEPARVAADRVIELIPKLARRDLSSLLSLSAAAETYVRVWEAAATDTSFAENRVAQLCRRIEQHAYVCPPARGRALLWRGCAEWLRGRATAAHRAWRECIREAERFGLPYECARANYEIGRRLEGTDPARRTHLARAEDGFRRLNAAADLERVLAAMDAEPSPSLR